MMHMRVTRAVFENALAGIAKLIADAQNQRPQVTGS
jgi:cation transport ATPase